MVDLSTPLMTRFEFDRMKALEASGMSHEAAKTQVYGERGPGGAPVTAGEGSVSPKEVTISPDSATSALVTPASNGNLKWLLVVGALVTGVYLWHKKGSKTKLVGDLWSTETGLIQAPKRKRRRKK